MHDIWLNKYNFNQKCMVSEHTMTSYNPWYPITETKRMLVVAKSEWFNCSRVKNEALMVRMGNKVFSSRRLPVYK